MVKVAYTIPKIVVEHNKIEDTTPLESGRSLAKIMDWQMMPVDRSKQANRTSEIRKGTSPILSYTHKVLIPVMKRQKL
jgi:hypothetical protein